MLLQTGCQTSQQRIFTTAIPKCPNVQLREAVKVESCVRTCAYRNERYVVQISYEELKNIPGVFPEGGGCFVNVHFLAYGEPCAGGFCASSATLILEIWRYHAQSRMKECDQWQIRDLNMDDVVDEMKLEVFCEDEWNIVRDCRSIAVAIEDCPSLVDWYRYCLRHLLRKLGVSAIENLARKIDI